MASTPVDGPPLSAILALVVILVLPPIGISRAHDSIDHQIDHVSDLLRRDPANASLHLERAELYRIGGFFEAAGRDLNRALELDHSLLRIGLCRAALEMDLGHPEAARRLIETYLEENPGDRDALELNARAGGIPPPRPAPEQRGEPAFRVSPNAAAATTALPRGATWKYLVTPASPGASWPTAGFVDGAWPAGPAVLGFGESYITTTIGYGPDAANKYRTTYFRIHFNVADPKASIQSLVLSARYDDGFVAYLNGVELLRAAMPAGAVSYSTYASSHEASAYQSFDVLSSAGSLAQGDNVLAVEVHQTSNSSSDLVWDCDLVYSTGSPVVTRGPYLQIGTPGGVTIRWRTSAPTSTRVRYGTGPGALVLFADGAPSTTEHEIQLSGLPAESRFYYSVGTTINPLVGGDSTYTFATSPAPGTPRPVRIWAIGDSGEPTLYPDEVRDGYLTYAAGEAADVWLMLGDNAYNAGTDAEYQAAVFDVYAPELRNTILWPTRGNHDALYSGSNNDYYEIFSMPASAEAGGEPSATEAWYSFDYGRVHFICLDSEGSSQSAAMMSWLATDLDSTAADWVIAYWHHPPYTKGSHDSDVDSDSGGRMKTMREVYLPILESRGVDLVLTGHSHSYERSLLLDEHYRRSNTLADSMKVDAGDGDPAGDGAYTKPTLGTGPHEGAIYAVAGSSSKTSGGPLNHPAMIKSLNELGSLVIDISGNQLDAAFVDIDGIALDEFSIIKGGATGVPEPSGSRLPVLGPNVPNPFEFTTRVAYELARPGRVDLSVFDVAGRKIRTLVAGMMTEGSHDALWDGRDGDGNAVPPGVYFSVLSSDGTSRSRKLVLSR